MWTSILALSLALADAPAAPAGLEAPKGAAKWDAKGAALEAYLAAEIKLRAQDFAGAEAGMRAALALQPGCGVVLRDLGHALGGQLRIDDADAVFTWAATLHPKSEDLRIHHARELYRLRAFGRLDEVAHALAVENPEHVEAHYFDVVADAFLGKGDAVLAEIAPKEGEKPKVDLDDRCLEVRVRAFQGDWAGAVGAMGKCAVDPKGRSLGAYLGLEAAAGHWGQVTFRLRDSNWPAAADQARLMEVFQHLRHGEVDVARNKIRALKDAAALGDDTALAFIWLSIAKGPTAHGPAADFLRDWWRRADTGVPARQFSDFTPWRTLDDWTAGAAVDLACATTDAALRAELLDTLDKRWAAGPVHDAARAQFQACSGDVAGALTAFDAAIAKLPTHDAVLTLGERWVAGGVDLGARAPALARARLQADADPYPRLDQPLAVTSWTVGGASAPFLTPGKLTLVEVWSADCKSCKGGLKNFFAMSKDYEGKVQFAAVSVDADAKKAEEFWTPFVEEHAKQAGAFAWGWVGPEGAKPLELPANGRLLVDGSGKVIAYYAGYSADLPRVLKATLDAALAGKL